MPCSFVSRNPACRQFLAAALGFILLLALGGLSVAQTPATAKPLRVGVSPVFPPMIFKQGKELAGVEADLARALGQQVGREIVFVELPWKDQIEALTEGKIDIIMSSMSITPARRSMVNFSKPYFVIGQMALVRRENKMDYALGFPYKLKGPVGALRATTGEFLVQRDFPKSTLKTFNNSEEAAKALIKKKINLFISDSTLVWHLAGKYDAEGLGVVNIPLSEEALGWAVRKTDDDLLNSINGFIEKASQDGTMRKAFSRWTAVGQ